MSAPFAPATAAQDALAAIGNKLLELALACAPRSHQQLHLVKLFSDAMRPNADAETYVSPDTLRSLANEARSILATSKTEDVRSVSVLVAFLEDEAEAIEHRMAKMVRFARNLERIKAEHDAAQAASRGHVNQ